MPLSRASLAGLILALPLLGACGGDVCDASDLGSGEASGTIDGTDWSSGGATWSVAGDSLQLTTTEGDGWRLTIVAGETAEGEATADALVDGETVAVALGDGSFVALYPTGVSGSYAANEAGDGDLQLTRTGDDIAVCFSVTGTASDDSTVEGSGTLLATCTGDGCN